MFQKSWGIWDTALVQEKKGQLTCELLVVKIGRTMPQSQEKPSSLRKICCGSMGGLHSTQLTFWTMAKGLEGSSDDLTRTKKGQENDSELSKAAGYQRNWGYSHLTIG